MQFGRREIFTDYAEVTSENVKAILRDAMITHRINADKCDFLLNYESGTQPLLRKKTYRSDIDIVCNDNIANEITEFKLGFNWGNPITLIQRGEADSGTKDETKAIALLNECYETQGNTKKTQELGRFVEICGVGYTYVDINSEWEDGDSYFTVDALDPRNSFVVKSSSLGHKPMLGVTYRQDKLGNYYFTCFSNSTRFEILNQVKIINGDKIEDADVWSELDRSGEVNPLGVIPIIEWVRSSDRMGVWERQISEMDNLNILVSDFSNDVDQSTQCIWMANDVDFPEDEDGNPIEPKSNDWIMTRTTQNGKTPFINPMTSAYDYTGMLNNIVTRRALILQKCNVPQRNDNSGGSTGIAMSDATGWSAAESAACKEELIIIPCKMQEVRAVLKAIQKSPDVPADSPLLKLMPKDMKPSIKRQKSYELTTKVNALTTAISHGIDYKTMIKTINLFDDPQQAIEDSEETMRRYLDCTFKVDNGSSNNTENDYQPNQDESDQIQNSPNIDGMNKQSDESEKTSEDASKQQKEK